MKTLSVSIPESYGDSDGKPFLVMTWTKTDGLRLVTGGPGAPVDFTASINQWNHGLHEYVRSEPNDPRSVSPRSTFVDHEEFLERLAAYMVRQFAFDIVISEVP